MSYESTILSALIGSSAITELCPAKKIYFGTMPRNAVEPFIFCQRVSTSPANTFDQGQAKATRLENILLQVTCYDTTLDKTLTTANAVRGVLEALASPRCMMQDQRSSYDDMPETFGQFCTFTTWYPSSL